MISICKQCKNEFSFNEKTYKTRIFCGRLCLNKSRAQRRRLPFDEYIKRANEIHSNKYDYSLAQNDIDGHKINIVCHKHGRFLQSRSSHLNGSGCRQCANESQRKGRDQFILEAQMVHGSIYDYSLVEYSTNATRVKIICQKHGIFEQLPYQHVNLKSGCPECIKNIRISKGEQDWLDFKGVPDSDEHRQVQIKIEGQTKWVDGFMNNTIYEYLGDYWHGNPLTYDTDMMNESTNKTFGQLYHETMQRIESFKKAGYNVEYIWESEWLKK